MRLSLLGTGGALTSPARRNTSVLVHDPTPLLVDCPADPPRAMSLLGFDWRLVDHVYLSHRHPDHVVGLVSLVLQRTISSRPGGWEPLEIFGPPSALDVARKLLDAVGLLHEREPFPLRFRSLSPAGEELSVGGLELVTAPSSHRDVETLALRVTEKRSEERQAFTYSADTEPCRAVADLARGAALLFHECSFLWGERGPGHSSLDDLDALAVSTDARRLVLVHLPPMEPALEAHIDGELEARFGDRVALGRDGMTYDL